MAKFKKNQKVVRIITAIGISTGSYYYIVGSNKNKGYISIAEEKNGSPYGHYDSHAYHKETGKAFENTIPGFSSKLVTLDEAELLDIEMEE